jgi:UPF0755 protein
MNNHNKKALSEKSILLLVSLLLVCLVLALGIALKVIHEENVSLIGEPDQTLSTLQTSLYDVTFFLKTKDIQKRNENLPESLIEIQAGKPLDEILSDLKSNGIVMDTSLLRKILIYTGADRKILPGRFPITAGSSILEIAATLQDPNASLIDFVVMPGWRKEEIAASLPTSGLSVTPDDFFRFVNLPVADGALQSLGVSEYEGFFFPGLYSFHRKIAVADFVTSLTNRFREELTEEMKNGFTHQGLSIPQAVVLASIIQREAIKDEEKPVIASVFFNRIKIGMPLQSDPTVQYALGFNPEWGWWKSPLTLDDLQTNSPYNTYITPGIPQTPISNPDLASLKAVAFPAESNYYYFRALCDGSKLHVFSETLEEHIGNACLEP